MELTVSELLFYGGIAVMAASLLLTILSIVMFCLTGRKLKKKLEQEYGKPRR